MRLRGRVVWFSRRNGSPAAASFADDEIVFRRDGTETFFWNAGTSACAGATMLKTSWRRVAAARLVGVEPGAIAQGVRSFAGVEHRIEYVATISGVEYFNDSKATNVDATLKALDAFPGNVLVILGGKDKGCDYTILRDALRSTRAWCC
jgi:UDP-N-acetylmuramoylalanine--D-glutamate ligase